MRHHLAFSCRAGLITVLCCLAGTTSAPAAAGNSYDDLVALFEDFREFQDATPASGIGDYSAQAVTERYGGLTGFQERLAAIEVDDWPIWQQVDYHLVRAEMNAMEFHHRVLKPWARDPGFYSILSGDAGASMASGEFGFRLWEMELPLSEDEEAQFRATLRAIPGVYEQARSNLTEASADLADLAIYNGGREAEIYDEVAERLQEHHPDLAADATSAGQALRDFVTWLEKNKHGMTAPAGVGKDNYSWWMRNVQLSPWGWEENDAIIQREYDRIITFLKLEENRNRNLPPLEVAKTELEYQTSLHIALRHVVDFLRDEEIMTIADWVNPADYTGFETLDELAERLGPEGHEPAEELLPENSSVDTKYRQREILPGETHEYIGHMLDEQREERLTKSPIRSAGRRYNMGSMRLEGWAVALEELLMQAGVPGRAAAQGPRDGVSDECLTHEPRHTRHEDGGQRDRSGRGEAALRGDHAARVVPGRRRDGLVRDAIEHPEPGWVSQQRCDRQGLLHEAVPRTRAGARR